MSSLTARTLNRLRKLGFLAATFERWIAPVKRHQDLFGVADVLGVYPRDRLVLLVQCTSAAHVGDRLKRIQDRPELPALLKAGVQVQVWGWRQVAGKWRLKVVDVRAEDLAGITVQEIPRRRRAGKGQRQEQLFE